MATQTQRSLENRLCNYVYVMGLAAQPVMGLAFWSRTWDDSAITLGFARTFALGGKIEPTIGSGIVEGYSTTLWMLLMAAVAKLSANPQLLLLTAKTGSILLNMLNICLVKTLVQRSRAASFAALTAGAFGLQSITIHESINGMEGPLCLTLFLIVLIYFRRDGWKALVIFSLAGALFILTRWEAAWFLIPLLLLQRRLTAAWAAATTWGFTFFASNLVRYKYFGSVFPNTIIAKSGTPYSHLNSRAELHRHIFAVVDCAHALFPLLLLLCVFATLDRAAIERRLVDFRPKATGLVDIARHHMDLSVCFSIVSFALVLALAVGTNWGPANRMLFVVWPALLYLILLPAWLVARRRNAVRIIAMAVVAIAIINLSLLARRLARADERIYTGYTTVDIVKRLVPILEQVRLAASKPDLLFAGPDMGGLILYSNHVRVIDTALLLDPTLARIRYKGFERYIFDQRHPDVIETHAPWTAESGICDAPRLYRDYAVLFVNGSRLLVTKSLLSAIPLSRLTLEKFKDTPPPTRLTVDSATPDERINERFQTYFVLR